MDGWPRSWRSLSWLSLAGEAVGGAVRWTVRQLYRHDPTRKYP